MFGAPTDAAFGKLKNVLGNPGSLEDPRFATNASRCDHQDALRAALETELGKGSKQHWLEKLEAAGLPCAPINTLDQVMTDPQVLANDMVVTSTDNEGNETRLAGLPFKLSGTPGTPGTSPPSPGQHNHTVLEELLGFDADAIATLERDGAI
jgi:CoA:oxalate CoA-transferase